MKTFNAIKSILILMLILSLSMFVIGCKDPEKNPPEEIYNVAYINENLNANDFKSYFYQKTIKNGDVLLLEENTNVSKQDNKYLVKTEVTKINPLDESSKYLTEEKEETVDIAQNPISLELKEEYFETVEVKQNSLTGKVKDDCNVLGYTVKDLNIKITLINQGKSVSEIELSYFDGDFKVTVIIKYNY